MKITIYTDCHIGTPAEVCDSVLYLNRVAVEQLNAYYLGDVIDRQGSEPVFAQIQEKRLAKMRDIFQGRFITGENEALEDNVRTQFLIVDQRILLVHGDIFWGIEKANDIRADAPYQGYGAMRSISDYSRKLFSGVMSEREARDAAIMAKVYGCKVIIYGHKHYPKVNHKFIYDVDVYSVPCGETVLDV